MPQAPEDRAEPNCLIRPFDRQDAHELRILIGMRVFEQLPVANWQIYMNPYVISAWLALSSISVQVMGWWPRDDISMIPFLGYLRPLPAFCTIGVPFLFLVDWLQRPYFEKQLRQELTSEDILHPSYYLSSSSKLSRFSILEWKKRPIGYIAIDAATPDEKLTNLEDAGELEAVQDMKGRKDVKTKTPPSKKKQLKPKRRVVDRSNLPSYAVVRHFHVDRVYQRSGIQKDLISDVVDEIFEASKDAPEKAKQSKQQVDKIFVRVTSTEPEAEATWRQLGFQDSSTRKGGKVADSGVLFGHYERWLEMSRARWKPVARM